MGICVYRYVSGFSFLDRLDLDIIVGPSYYKEVDFDVDFGHPVLTRTIREELNQLTFQDFAYYVQILFPTCNSNLTFFSLIFPVDLVKFKRKEKGLVVVPFVS
eukprot:TRINITY_DN2009_c0_g1_i8.p1 TRINITY_DN2009_c0_g1~~TRINITY_DN2009_c0_g1_i8.p1  ORF type:complete len:103 (-),score=10.98 TRINITY_DN2009_c0_g1_i8:22-330(-)